MGGSASHELVLYPSERVAVSAGGRHGKLQAIVGAWAMRCSQAKLLPATTQIYISLYLYTQVQADPIST